MKIIKQITGIILTFFGVTMLIFCLVNLIKILMNDNRPRDSYNLGFLTGTLLTSSLIGFLAYKLSVYGVKLIRGKEIKPTDEESEPE